MVAPILHIKGISNNSSFIYFTFCLLKISKQAVRYLNINVNGFLKGTTMI